MNIRKISPINSLSSRKHGARVKISGTIQEVAAYETKNAGAMATVRIADDTGSIEVFIFPDLYRETAQRLMKGAAISFQGKIFKDPGGDTKLVAKLTCRFPV